MEVSNNQFINYLTDSYINFVGVFKGDFPPNKICRKEYTHSSGGFLLPVSGSARFHFENIDFDLEVGTLLHASPNTLVEKKITSKENWVYFLFFYDIPDEQIKKNSLYNKEFIINHIPTVRLFDLSEQLLERYKIPSVLNDFYAKITFMELIGELVFCTENYRRKSSNNIIDNIAQYINENYYRDLSISKLAESLGMDRRVFSQLFKGQTGKTPTEYIINLRINEAKHLLKTNKYTIGEISKRVGYVDNLYFSRIFKKKVGVSPNKYKNK